MGGGWRFYPGAYHWPRAREPVAFARGAICSESFGFHCDASLPQENQKPPNLLWAVFGMVVCGSVRNGGFLAGDDKNISLSVLDTNGRAIYVL